MTAHTHQAPTPLPRSTDRAVQEVITRIQALHTLYEEETDALENVDAQRFLLLQDRKLETAQSYESALNDMLKRKSEFESLRTDIKDKLRAMQADFTELAQRNTKALRRMQKASERLSGTLMNAARDSLRKKKVTHYKEDGSISDYSHKAVSISINETA